MSTTGSSRADPVHKPLGDLVYTWVAATTAGPGFVLLRVRRALL